MIMFLKIYFDFHRTIMDQVMEMVGLSKTRSKIMIMLDPPKPMVSLS